MTDKQFNLYKISLLRELERVQAELAIDEIYNATLDCIINNFKSELENKN